MGFGSSSVGFAAVSALIPPSYDIDLGSAEGTATTATQGPPRAIKMARYPTVSGATRTVKFEGVLYSSIDNTNTEARLYDVTAGVYVTGSTVDNSGAGDQSVPTAFSVAVTAGTSSGHIRTDVDHVYAVHVFRVGGSASDLCVATGSLSITYA